MSTRCEFAGDFRENVCQAGRSLQQPCIRTRSAVPDTALPAEAAGHAVASVVKACLKPSDGRAQSASSRASLAQTRFEKTGESRLPLRNGEAVFARQQPADQQRGNGSRAPANRLERCTPLTSATRAESARGLLLHPKSSLKRIPHSNTSGTPFVCCLPAPSTTMMPQQCHACIKAFQPCHALTSWLPDDAIDCTCPM